MTDKQRALSFNPKLACIRSERGDYIVYSGVGRKGAYVVGRGPTAKAAWKDAADILAENHWKDV